MAYELSPKMCVNSIESVCVCVGAEEAWLSYQNSLAYRVCVCYLSKESRVAQCVCLYVYVGVR